ncbi:MAG: hypothetical protein Q4C22_00950 [Bacillota bacterium]|nr:hypothetical protein [Bacillota bacterium]
MKKKDKREYPNGFYLIDNRITMFALTPIQLAVYNCICRHGNAHHLSHLRMATIAGEAGCAVSSARLAIRKLEELNLISVSPDFKDAPGGGKWHGANYYKVLELPAYVQRQVPPGKEETAPDEVPF